MAIQRLNTIKNWFKTGLKPTQQQFWDTWDSFWHKDTIIPAVNIENLDARFQEKTDQDAFVSHLQDQTAHGLNHKANLEGQNHFSAENTFSQPLRTPQVLTNSGIAFNLDFTNKITNPGFGGKLNFDIASGTLKFDATHTPQQAGETPAYDNTALTVYHDGNIELPGILTAAELALGTDQSQEQRLSPSLTPPSTNTQLYFPTQSGTIARIEDLPTIKAGENIILTGTYPEIIINATGGSGASPISMAYEELKILVESGNLTAGQQYLINDFQSSFFYPKHTVTETGGEKTEALSLSKESYYGPIEPIIVTALRPTMLSQLARSTVYESDELIYSIFDYFIGLTARGKGTIRRRIDTALNNIADFDYRSCKYRTNSGETKSMVNLLGNCRIESNLAIVIIREMKDSQLITSSSELGNYMLDGLYNSNLIRSRGTISSSNISIDSCDMKLPRFSINKGYAPQEIKLNYIYANLSENTTIINDDIMLRHLANKPHPSYVVPAADGSMLLQNNTINGVTITPMI